MITPINYQLEDFITKPQEPGEEMPKDYWYVNAPYQALKAEGLSGPTLIDNLLLLKFVPQEDIQRVLAEKYHMPFTWVKVDMTPQDLKPLAQKYNVLFQRKTDELLVFVQLGETLDEAALGVDIPTHRLRFVFIADCNYRLLMTGMPANLLSYNLADFRPLLVLRRLVQDCKIYGGTDIHFASMFMGKVPAHHVQYRHNKQLIESLFFMDKDMMVRVAQAAVSQLSSASASDLFTMQGVTTDIPDLFQDGSTDLRLVGSKVEAGIYVVIAIQSAATTTMRVDELGFPKQDVQTIRNISRFRTGLTLVTGEMRSGKNTTIFAMLNEIIPDPIRIVEYSNPIENRMPIIQINYKGNLDVLMAEMRMAKKQDIDIAVLNEIPNAEVAFAVRDLVNSAIGVITTTHVDRVWHVPNKLYEFFGKDYKNIITSLNAVINHKMFLRWSAPGMQRRVLQPSHGVLEQFAYKWGVRQYFVPPEGARVIYDLQPLTEIWVLTDEQKTAMLNFDELWRAEQMIRSLMEREQLTIEHKLAQYINNGLCSLDEMGKLCRGV